MSGFHVLSTLLYKFRISHRVIGKVTELEHPIGAKPGSSL